MADRQTALAVFDFLDSLRAGQYRIGADAAKDHATAGLLASLSGDTGLRDAVCAKLISPGMERARFLMVAEHDPRALPLFASGQVKPWYQADYNVREIANSEFHQDIPALLWRLSNTMDAEFCVEALKDALAKYGTPEIFNTDQGSQFTGSSWVEVLVDAKIKISMDGKGRWIDNRMIERLWRSLKYECVYLHAFERGSEAKAGIGKWLAYYNAERPHSTHGILTPNEAYATQTEPMRLAA